MTETQCTAASWEETKSQGRLSDKMQASSQARPRRLCWFVSR